MDERLAAVQLQVLGRAGDRVVGHRQKDQIGLVENGPGIRKGARAGHLFLEPSALLGVTRGDRAYLPAGARERVTQRRPDTARSDEGDRRSSVLGMGVLAVLVVGGALVVGAF